MRFKMQDDCVYWRVHLTVFGFSAAGGIKKHYPRGSDYEVICAGEERIFDIRCDVRGRDNASTSTFKAFITLPPTSFTAMQRGNIIKYADVRREAYEEDREGNDPKEDDDDDDDDDEDISEVVASGPGLLREPRWRTIDLKIRTTAPGARRRK